MAAVGLSPAAESDFEQAHALVARLVGPPLATVKVMRAVHERSRTSVMLIREGDRITGLLGELPLVQAGLHALETGTFSGVDPVLEYIARPGDALAAYYCWGFAAETRRAAAIGVRGVITARDQIYGDLPFFARAAKPAADGNAPSNGARVGFRRFGCTYYPGQPDLLYSPKSITAGRAAA